MALLDPTLLKARLGLLAGRFDVDALDECDSTSSELARRAEKGAPAGTVVVADRQTAGRGRRGRRWLSAPADSLTFSLLWRFSGPPGRLSGLSLAVGVAVVLAAVEGGTVLKRFPRRPRVIVEFLLPSGGQPRPDEDLQDLADRLLAGSREKVPPAGG